MIIALLFLILFAILFPKALRLLFALLFIGGIMVLGEVHAGYDCHDGKHDDCTAKWSKDHAPRGSSGAPVCQQLPCENGDTPIVDAPEQDIGSMSCQTIIDGGWSHMPDATDYVMAQPHSNKLGYASACRINSLIFGQCFYEPEWSIKQAANALIKKAVAGKPLPGDRRCGA